MASTFPQASPRNTKEIVSQSIQMLVILAAVFSGAFLLLVLWTTAATRNFAIIAGVFIVFIGTFVSANPRLYCVSALMLTIPLTLSKRVGVMFLGKPGGEDSFKIEASDLFLWPLVVF